MINEYMIRVYDCDKHKHVVVSSFFAENDDDAKEKYKAIYEKEINLGNPMTCVLYRIAPIMSIERKKDNTISICRLEEKV